MINTFNEGFFDSIEVEDPKSVGKRGDRAGQKFVFEISNVELLADMSAINIYWLSSSDERINVAVEAALNAKLSSQIRSRLIEDRVINYVPRIVFCRDPSRVISEKLDEYLGRIELEKKCTNVEEEKQEEKNTHEEEKKTG